MSTQKPYKSKAEEAAQHIKVDIPYVVDPVWKKFLYEFIKIAH